MTPVLPTAMAAVVARGNGQREDAVADAFEVDLDLDRLFVVLLVVLLVIFLLVFVVGVLVFRVLCPCRRLLAVVALSWAGRNLFCPGSLFVLLFVLDLFVVAFGRNGRSAVLGEHGDVGGAGLRAVERGQIDAGAEGPSSVEARK
jgi:hypothetical protein